MPLVIKSHTILLLLTSLAILSAISPSILFLNSIFNAPMRWGFLMLLFLYLVYKKKIFTGLTNTSGLLLILFLTYGVATTLWSPIPQLSGPKSTLLALVALTYATAGAYWVQLVDRRHSLNILLGIVLVSILVGIGGASIEGSTIAMNQSVELYKGLANNSNLTGIVMLCSMPLLLFLHSTTSLKTYLGLFILAVLLINIAVLIFTVSRASILSLFILLTFYFFGRGSTQIAGLLFLILTGIFFTTVLAPEALARFEEVYIFKGGNVEQGVFESRRSGWSSSILAAKEGGGFGLGFGVSHGFHEFDFILSSSSYGREKGNSTLALVEEMGIIGMVLFFSFIIALFSGTINAVKVARKRADLILLLLLMGSIIALIANAQFEAWLFSPGGAAAPTFWATVGICSQVSRCIVAEKIRENQILNINSVTN